LTKKFSPLAASALVDLRVMVDFMVSRPFATEFDELVMIFNGFLGLKFSN
jgi:hypothetical protein